MNHHPRTVPEMGQINYRKSSYSNRTSGCVEVAGAAGGLWLRDSKNPSATPHYLTERQWDAFIGRVKTGKFDS